MVAAPGPARPIGRGDRPSAWSRRHIVVMAPRRDITAGDHRQDKNRKRINVDAAEDSVHRPERLQALRKAVVVDDPSEIPTGSGRPANGSVKPMMRSGTMDESARPYQSFSQLGHI